MANRTFADYAADLATSTGLDSVIGLEGSTVKTAAPGGTLTVSPQDDDFTANGASGTVYTSEGVAGVITATLEDSPVGTEYTFVNVDGFEIRAVPDAANFIAFVVFDGVAFTDQIVPGDGDWLETNGNFASFTILKISATHWVVTASNGLIQAND